MPVPLPDPVRAAATERLRLRASVPVPLEILIDRLRSDGVRYITDDTLVESGCFDHASKEIRVRAGDSPERRKFTTAHEYGHLVLFRAGLSSRRGVDDPVEERWCDRFAGELLVPVEWARARFAQHPESLGTLVEAAHIADVSVSAMLATLHNGLRWGSALLVFRLVGGSWRLWSSTFLPSDVPRNVRSVPYETDRVLGPDAYHPRRARIPLRVGDTEVKVDVEVTGRGRSRWVLLRRADLQAAHRRARREGPAAPIS